MDNDDIRILIEMATMYYEEGATQDEVATRFNVSRSLVSKYLSRARDMGIIEISINTDKIHPYRHLEEEVKKLYGLDNVLCVEYTKDFDTLYNRIGITAANYLKRVMKNNSVVGVSSGRALQATAKGFQSNVQLPGVTFIPLVGGLAERDTDIQANAIAELLSQKTGGKSEQLYTPVLVDSSHAKTILSNQSFIRRVFDLAKNVDIAMIGIGGTPTYYEVTTAYLHKIDGPVEVIDPDEIRGDICYNFLDKNGMLAECDWNRRVMSLSLEEIRDIPYVIAASGGEDKHFGILAAISGKLIDTLITDTETCQFLIEQARLKK